MGPIVRNTGGTANFNGTSGTITTTRPNTNGILGPWATYGSGTSMKYAAGGGGGTPYTIAPYTAATAITSGVTGLADTSRTQLFAFRRRREARGRRESNTVQFTGSGSTITAPGVKSLSLNGILNVGSGVATISGGSLNIGAPRKLDYDLDTPATSGEVLMPTGELILGGQPVFDFTWTANFGESTTP